MTERECGIGGMILTWKGLNMLKETCSGTTYRTTNPTRTGLEPNLCLRGQRSATNRLSESAGFED
jgi:hypothetical protein